MFDIILSNPPYFSASLKNPDRRLSMARHNDTLTLEELFKGVKNLLSDDGRFTAILPYGEANLSIAVAAGYKLYCNRMLNIKPLPSKPVKRVLLEFERKKKPLDTGYLIIETGGRHKYSREFINLTKDFYLDL